MSKRFTITTKWEDGWFWQLKPYEKLLWNYLCDKCDLAGFWEINLELATVQTKIPKSAISGAVQGLNRGYYTNGKYLWLRNFIHHQGNYPLNSKNNAHRHIIAILERHTDFDIDFFEILETVFLGAVQEGFSPPSKGNSNSKGKGNSKYTEDFEKFWKKFTGRWDSDKDRYVKVGKYSAWEEWQHLKAEEKEKALAAADRVSGKFTPDACRWLKRKMFDDFTVKEANR